MTRQLLAPPRASSAQEELEPAVTQSEEPAVIGAGV